MILSLQLVRNIFDTTMELCNSLQAKKFVNMFVCVETLGLVAPALLLHVVRLRDETGFGRSLYGLVGMK